MVYEFVVADGRAHELVISADGRPELFGAVIDIVKAAPALEGWKVTAFRQPRPTTVSIEVSLAVTRIAQEVAAVAAGRAIDIERCDLEDSS